MVDGGGIALSQPQIGRLLELSRVFVFSLPLGSGESFVDGEDVALFDSSGVDIDVAVFGFLGVRESPKHGGPNFGNVSRTEGAGATVVDDGLLLGDVKANEAGLETYRSRGLVGRSRRNRERKKERHTPIKEGPSRN